jgi:hypothetical protein
VLAFDRLPKKRLGGRDIALGAQPEVNRPPRPIHGTIEIAPFPCNDRCVDGGCLCPRQRALVRIRSPAVAISAPTNTVSEKPRIISPTTNSGETSVAVIVMTPKKRQSIIWNDVH